MNLESLLKNCFSCDREQEPFVDLASHIALSFSRSYLGIQEICPRGVMLTRNALTRPALELFIQTEKKLVPMTGIELASLAGRMELNGRACVNGTEIICTMRVAAQQFNCYRIHLAFQMDGPVQAPLTLVGAGRWSKNALDDGSERDFQKGPGRAAFAVRHHHALCERMTNITEDWGSTWQWTGNGGNGCDWLDSSHGFDWMLNLGTISCDAPIELALQCENRPWNIRFNAYPAVDFSQPFDAVAQNAKKRILDLMQGLPGQERTGWGRELRAAMILDRTSYKGGAYGNWNGLVASMCMVDDWGCTSFFWDSAFGALGLVEFNPEQACQALEVLFPLQRDDGCVPTNTYEYAIGSTYLPQPPVISWAVNHILERTGNTEFVKRMLPKMRGVFDWYTLTQDQDRDGLPEFRFTGQIADNSPLYDEYIMHVPKHGDLWNVYLPPIASPALAAFVYSDAHFLAKFYRMFGDETNAAIVEKRVEAYPELLLKICYDTQTGYFQDYDHNTLRFNRCRVLTALLPIWAGMPLDETLKKRLIEENLLSPLRFGGNMPFPYVARDDKAYEPKGYWRGRIWPHTTTWMLELLWQNGYQKEADELADNLIHHVLDREVCIRENYYSGDEPGGGSEDFQWSSGVYLYLRNRRYRCGK